MRGIFEKVKGGGNWYIRFTDRKRRRHREHAASRGAVEELLLQRRREVRDGTYRTPDERKSGIGPEEPKQPKDAPTFEQLFRMRQADLERDLSAKTYQHHEYSFGAPHLERLKKTAVNKIGARDVDAVLSGLHKAGISNGTMRNYRALISAVFAYGIKRDLLTKNPVLQTKSPKASKGLTRYLTEDEEKAIRKQILECCPEREAEFDLLLHTGMRSGEAYALTWDRVGLERGAIDVPDSGRTGWRPIPLNAASRMALEILHVQSRGSKYVVPHSARENWRLGIWFGEVVKKAGVLGRVTPHILRHTFASRLVMAGVDLRTVQQFLGHSNIQMTMRYAHLSPEHGQAAIEKLVRPAAPATATAKVAMIR